MLHRARLNELSGDADVITMGATTTLAAVAAMAPEPLASAARIPDHEIRGQGTLGGNLHVPGDLHAALIVLGARVRSAGRGGERVETVEAYLAGSEPRLALAVEVRRPRAAAFLAQRRPHAHTFSVLSVAVAERDDGLRVAVGGVGERGLRCPSVERALAEGADPSAAAQAVGADVEPLDDPLASAWYRRRVLPVLVARALGQMKEVR